MNIENAMRVLNELLKLDPTATAELFGLSVQVNRPVCDHPTIQVRGERDADSGMLSFLGLINGMLNPSDRVIVMKMTDDRTIIEFAEGVLEGESVRLD